MAVDVVGYSGYTFPGVEERRRHASGSVDEPDVDAGPGAGSVTSFKVTMASGTAVCKGDSGGPVFFQDAGAYKVGGVVNGGQAGADPCNVTETFLAAYVPRSFLDDLCRHGAWEACTGSSDRDEDGTADSLDNPNASQRNSNAAGEVFLHPGLLGDACDSLIAERHARKCAGCACRQLLGEADDGDDALRDHLRRPSEHLISALGLRRGQ